MGSDFTVIVDVRHHFGNDQGTFGPGLLFAGQNKPFGFDCPNVDTAGWAVLLFQTRDVDYGTNELMVNRNKIYGGIPVSSSREDWNANVALINPGWLRPSENVLHVGSRDGQGSLLGESDDFLIDNVVVFYKTRSRWGLLPWLLRR